MMKSICFMLLVCAGACLGGCFQVNSDDELRTVPITNNPQLIPGSTGGLPGMPIGGASGAR